MSSPPVPPSSAMDKAFEPYALEIGFLLREWNDLQEMLSNLFVSVLGFKDGTLSLAIWHVVPVDRFQRAMLRAAAAHIFAPPDSQSEPTRVQRENAEILEEINWILDSADALGRQRDDAAHLPMALLLAQPLRFIAHHFHGHPIGKKLRDKEDLVEFRLYRERAATLRVYANRIEQYLRGGRHWTLPRRPAWPALPQSSGDKNQRQHAKERSRPPSTSQG
jgi:hypothetical protein